MTNEDPSKISKNHSPENRSFTGIGHRIHHHALVPNILENRLHRRSRVFVQQVLDNCIYKTKVSQEVFHQYIPILNLRFFHKFASILLVSVIASLLLDHHQAKSMVSHIYIRKLFYTIALPVKGYQFHFYYESVRLCEYSQRLRRFFHGQTILDLFFLRLKRYPTHEPVFFSKNFFGTSAKDACRKNQKTPSGQTSSSLPFS